MTYRLEVPGQPLPKERPRHANGHTYTPPKTRAEEKRIADMWRAHLLPRLTGDVRLTLIFYRETRRNVDVDNLAKLVQDALNGVAYEDDRQIVELRATKHLGCDFPMTVIKLEEA